MRHPTLFVSIVLLWPAASQRKHWYAMVCVAMLVPFLADSIFWHMGFSALLEKMRAYPSLYGGYEAFALCACGLYLVLIRWQHRRLARPTTPNHP